MNTAGSHRIDPRYEAIDATLPADQWDDFEPSNIEELDRQIATDSSKELEKIAIKQSRFRVLLRVLALLVPVGLSFAILQLSWRHIYWRNSNHNPRAISEDLAILQIAAKAHEVLMVLSLSDLVLHFLRQQVSSAQGLPFGLFTSAYQVALGSQPISYGFFHGICSSFQRPSLKWRQLALAIFLLVSTLLGLAVGPSSAIALIPRLGWWPDADLMPFYTRPKNFDNHHPSHYTMYIPKLLFPGTVDSSSLPGPYCMNQELDVNGSCPFAGFQDLLPGLNFSTKADNNTIDTPLQRVMSTHLSQPVVGIAASTWTTSHVLANYMSLDFEDDSYNKNPNPNTIETKTHGDAVLAPIVSVFCDQQYANVFVHDLGKLANGFSTLPGYDDVPAPSGTFDIRSVWNLTDLAASNTTKVAFVEDTPNATVPGLLALVYTPAINEQELANISVCGIVAFWEPSKMSVLASGSNAVVLSNFTWDGYNDAEAELHNKQLPGVESLKHSNEITIRKDWADALNPVSNTSTTSILAKLLNDGAEVARQQGRSYDASLLSQNITYSVMLSKAFADGLSRIGAEYRVNPLFTSQRNITICRHQWCSSGTFDAATIGGPRIFNGTWEEWDGYTTDLNYGARQGDQQLLHSYPKPDDADTVWTRISFPRMRYGYAWSFDTVTVKVATAVLMSHTLIIVLHCCFILYTGRSYNFASSLGDLLALALNSRPPAALESTSVGVNKGKSWARTTAVREFQSLEKDGVDRLEIVANESGTTELGDGDLHRRVIAGKRYR